MDPLNRRFRVIAFDWDGTAVTSRSAPAHDVKHRLEPLMAHEVACVVITGTHLGNVNPNFCQLVEPSLRRYLYACVNRGSEVYGFDADGELLTLHQRVATDEENAIMDRIAIEMRDEVRDRYGLEIGIVFDRMNRRKIDLIPLPEWADPPKAIIGELLVATEKRLHAAGIERGIKQLIDHLADKVAASGVDLRITSDVKHLEFGLTDKSDSVRYVLRELARPRGVPNEEILILGDEFGPISGFEGSDFRTFIEEARGAIYVSVGKEPNGAPAGVIHYGKGIPGFMEIMDHQRALWEQHERTPGGDRRH